MSIDITALRERIASAQEVTADVIDDLNALTHSLIDTDPVTALETAKRTINDAYSIRYPQGESQALMQAGMVSSKQRQFDDASIFFQRALRIKEELNDKPGMAAVITKIGNSELRAGNYSAALVHYNKAIELLNNDENDLAVADLYANTGSIYGFQSNYAMGLKFYIKALKIFEQLNETSRIAITAANIGLMYIEQKNFEEAMTVFNRALGIRRKAGDKYSICALLNNIGFAYQEQGKYEEAIKTHEEVLKLNEEVGDKSTTATSFSNLGSIYKKLGDTEKAKEYYEKSLAIFDTINDKRGLLQSYNNLGELYYEQQEYEKAYRYLDAAIKLSSETGVKTQQRQAYEFIAMIHAHRRQFEQAYKYQRLFSQLDREISSNEVKTQMSQMSLRYELEQREQATEMERIKNIELRKAFNLLEEEKKRSEELLLNILPVEISNELKQSGKTKARSFEMVTVLFTDIKGFTKISEQFSAEEIVTSIDEYFEMFDHIVEKHNIEKIKTIGDAYLCASGIPVSIENHAERMIEVAKDFISAVAILREKRHNEGKHTFDFRIGIHSGPVVAGVVGIKKFAYDIWGDTVNTASRMQSNGEPNRINISEATYDLIKDKVPCIYRGEIEAKNKGKLKMYFVE